MDTNNHLSIEIGPEPDFGKAPEENLWSGYIGWPTNLGDGGAPKPPGTPLPGYSPATSGDPGNGTACPFVYGTGHLHHGHYSMSDWLHTNAAGERRNLNRFTISGEINECWPDPLPAPVGASETMAGPYDPWRGPDPASASPGNRHRLARSFRVPNSSGTGALPAFDCTAPLDLRIDGIYLERHSTLAYWITPNAVGLSTGIGHRQYQLLFNYWIKPKYYPEMAGKIREYWNFSRMDVRGDLYDTYPVYNDRMSNPAPMTHYFCAAQRPTYEWPSFVTAAGVLVWNGTHGKYNPIRPASMMFLHMQSFETQPGAWCPSRCYGDAGNSMHTPTLNHHYHDVASYPGACTSGAINVSCRRQTPTGSPAYQPAPYYLLRNPLAAGRWMHFQYYWNFTCGMDGVADDGWSAQMPPLRRTYINGLDHGNYTVGPYGAQPTYNVAYGGYNFWPSVSRYIEFGGPPEPAIDCCRHTNSNATIAWGGTSFTGLQSIVDLNVINAVRIGESDVWVPAALRSSISGSPASVRNFAPDATIDEYNLLTAGGGTGTPSTLQQNQSTAMLNLYRYGRYHIPRSAVPLGPGPLGAIGAAEGRYISPRFNLPNASTTLRSLPPPSTVTPPSGPPVPVPPGAGAGVAPTAKIIGVAWTWAAESVDVASPNLDPTLTDYSTITLPTPQTLKPNLQCYVKVGAQWYGPCSNEFFSALQGPGGGPVLASGASAQNLQYCFNYWWPTSMSLGAFVHAQPYIDDITIYYDAGDAGFVDYHLV